MDKYLKIPRRYWFPRRLSKIRIKILRPLYLLYLSLQYLRYSQPWFYESSLTERNDDLVTKSISSAACQKNVNSNIGTDNNSATKEDVNDNSNSSSECDSMTDSCQEGINHKLEKMWMNK